MDKIQVKEMYDVIIVEKSDDTSIFKGSKLFCGCCGGMLATTTKKLTLPIKAGEFKASLENKTFSTSAFGFLHETCGHTMFPFKKEYAFTKLEDYLAQP